MHTYLKFIFSICLFLNSLISYTQVKTLGIPNIKNFKKTDYLAGTQNWNIAQDQKNNIYFANNKGLLQFDGVTWQNHQLPKGSSIRALNIDSESGRIYVGSYNDLGYFESDENGILQYQTLTPLIEEANKLEFGHIWKIHMMHDEIIFQSFERAFIYNKESNSINYLEAPHQFQFSFKIDDILYLQDTKFGLHQYQNGILKKLKGTDVLNETEIWGLFKMPNNTLLITTLKKGAFIYDFKTVTPWKTKANDFLKENNSLGGTTYNNNTIALNTVLNGMIIVNTDGEIIQHLNLDKGLQNNTILSSFVDNQNNIWLGLDNGITYINENSPLTFFGVNYNISTVYGTAIYKNNIYIATNQGVFYHPWGSNFNEDDRFVLVEGTTAQSWNVQVINNQLICANNQGALVIEGGKVVNTLDSKGYYNFKTIPSNTNFIIGANYDGFALFEKTDTGIKYIDQISGFDKESNTYELSESYLWVFKENLIYQLNLSKDFKHVNTQKVINQLAPNTNDIHSIQKIDNTVYFQTNNKFYRYEKNQNTFILDQNISNLFKDKPLINSVTEDLNGNLWYNYKESLGVLKKTDSLNYEDITAPFSKLTDNLVSNYISVYTLDQNNVFIGLTDGLAHFDFDFNKDYTTKPLLSIKSFSYGEKTLNLGNLKTKTPELALPYSANNIKFTFAAPVYENANTVVYSYQLVDYDKHWSDWSNTTMKEYTNLREGQYTMKIKAKNSYGVSSKEALLTFSIAPPWYRHFLAYLAYLLIIALAFYLTSRNAKLKIRKNKYYETIEQRKLYLEKESKIIKQQHHLEKEIEALKNEKLQTKILTKDKQLVNNSLQIAKQNKLLKGIVNKLKAIETDALNEATKNKFEKLKSGIIKEINNDSSWKDLEKHIKNVHFDFLKRLKEKHPKISPRELDLSTYLLLNMSTKEIAEVMNISTGGVELARYRLRKKLELKRQQNLTGYLMNI
ncbi:triple tyrosine motif-containing protein [Tamlana sp. I1]|uniref:triple tyrosine motif-containing protein n=1 Tax=Tamlana sp. I1 TaxID=2762061 RepID=UPI00188F49DF|nr:triple tyrosine motif-containing protein [Tamlana sp. I1]